MTITFNAFLLLILVLGIITFLSFILDVRLGIIVVFISLGIIFKIRVTNFKGVKYRYQKRFEK